MGLNDRTPIQVVIMAKVPRDEQKDLVSFIHDPFYKVLAMNVDLGWSGIKIRHVDQVT